MSISETPDLFGGDVFTSLDQPDAITALNVNQEETFRKMTDTYQSSLKNVVPALMEFVKVNYSDKDKLFSPGAAVSVQMVTDLLARAGLGQWFQIDPYLLGAAQTSIDALKDIYPEMMFTPDNLSLQQSIQQTKSVTDLEFGRVSSAMTRAVMNELLSMQLIPRPLKAVSTVFAEQQHISKNHASTVLNTAMAMQQRTTSIAGGKALNKAFPEKERWFFYGGPTGQVGSKRAKGVGVIRPFCSHLVNSAIRQKDMGKLNNNNKGAQDFSLYGGGYNCRHSLTPVTETWVKVTKTPRVDSKTIDRANRAAKGG